MASVSQFKDQSPRWLKDVANVTTRSYAMATANFRPAPDFLIIGAKRGGTTSLFNYLLMHPAVLGLFPQSRGKKSTDYYFKELQRGDRWYRSHFHTALLRQRMARDLGYRPAGGEASPYYIWDPRIAQQARRTAPELRAILLVRDPVERAWSHYQERRQNGVEPLSFRDALAVESLRTSGELERMNADPCYYSEVHDWYTYRARGIYLPQINNWLQSFPAQQLLVLRSEDMYADVQGVFDEVCTFLGVGLIELPTKESFNASGAREGMPDDIRRELTEFYRPHNLELESFLGRSMGWAS